MDLFNPVKLYNYKIMIKDLDFSKFENPTIQVVWEDFADNFTQDKLKSVKSYFQKKYNTTNVNVLTKTKLVDEETTTTIDVSMNITDPIYQLDLLRQYVTKGC
jgi:predicted lipoprotein